MTAEDLPARVRATIAAIASVRPADVDAGMTLTGDLPFDSLQLLELVAALEDEFGVTGLDEDEMAGIETVGDVEALLAGAVETAGR